MQPSQAEIGRLLSEKPKDQNELHATMNAALTFLKGLVDDAASVDDAPRVNSATIATVVSALLSYISRNADTKDDIATFIMNSLSKASEATAEDRGVLLSVASLYVDKYRIRTTTALNLILEAAHSPFAEHSQRAGKVWRGEFAASLDSDYLAPFATYFSGPEARPISSNPARDDWIMLLTGESGSGKTCLAHQLAEKFVSVKKKRVGVAVYLRWGGHFVVPDKLRSRPSAEEDKAAHTADVVGHLAKFVASLLTACDGKALPADKSVQRVAVVIDESSGIMSYVRGLIAEPSAFTKALHAELGGAAAALDGDDSTGFRVAIIVAGTGCGVASCDDATSQQISSHPKHFREVQLPVDDSNTKLRDAILRETALIYVSNFLLGRPETEPLTTNPRTLWALMEYIHVNVKSFSYKSAYFQLTGDQAFAHAEMVSASAAKNYLESNGLAHKSEDEKDFYLTLACAFVLFKNRLFSVPDTALKVLARYGFLVDNKVANKKLPDGVSRFTMSSAIRRTISVHFCYKLDRVSSLNGVALERITADFFSFLVRVVSGFPSSEEYAFHMKQLDVPAAAAAAAAAASVKAATVAAATVAAPVPEEAPDEAVPDEAATTIAPAATDPVSTTAHAVTTFSDGLLHLLTVMQPSFRSSDNTMLRNIPLISSTGSACDDRIVYSDVPIDTAKRVRDFFGRKDNAARLRNPGDVLIVINGRMASYADVIVVWKDVATLLVQAKDLGPKSSFSVLAELAKMGMCAKRAKGAKGANGTEEKKPPRKHRDTLLALCKLFPKNQVIPIFVLRNREISFTVRGEDYLAHVPTRASGTDGPGSTAKDFEGFFVTPIVLDRNDIYPVVGPNVAASNDVSSAAAPAAPA